MGAEIFKFVGADNHGGAETLKQSHAKQELKGPSLDKSDILSLIAGEML